LEKLAAADLGRCVPGHGPVGGVDDLLMVKRYIITLLATAEQALENDTSDDDLATIPVPTPFDEWVDGYSRFERNLRFLLKRKRPSSR
jgi:hypothetical protein